MLGTRLAALLLLSSVAFAETLPAGTVVPIMLSTGLNARKGDADKKIEGSVMQDVPLPTGGKINVRSRVFGHVVSVTKPDSTKSGASGASIVLKFDIIEDHGRTIKLTAALLAVASMESVADAQAPIENNSDLDPISQWVTRQVGGDVVNRGRGKVASNTGIVGTWVEGSWVTGKLTPNPEAGCPSGSGYDQPQALWLFSSAACGTYGFPNVKIGNAGRTPPLGEIELKSDRNITIRGGSGWLLISVAGE